MVKRPSRVAGDKLPAFVERYRRLVQIRVPGAGVAGDKLPAFVERPDAAPPSPAWAWCRRG